MTEMTDTDGTVGTSDARAAAVKRLSARRDFVAHVVAFVVVNAGIVAIWLATGHGYFWPAWLIGVWAAGLVLHAWDVLRAQTHFRRGDPARDGARGSPDE